MTSTGRPAAAWYPDPSGRHQHRYWDGERWTLHVSDDGVPGIDRGSQQSTASPQQLAVRQVDLQPVADQPAVVQEPPVPQWAQASASGWTEVPEKPAPKSLYEWPSTTPSAWQPTPATPAATYAPTRSAGRIWAVAIAVIVAIAGVSATAVLALGGHQKSGILGSADQKYPAIIETNFVQGCTANGGTISYCQCALDHLEDEYDLGDLAQMGKDYVATGKLPDGLMDVVKDCVAKQFQPQQQ
jgi:hypothetical protein